MAHKRDMPTSPLSPGEIVLLIITTILAFFIFYAPQPLLPFFARTLAISESRAALLMTATMLPLSIAPLSYGYVLETWSAIKLLRLSIGGLIVTEIGFVLADSFPLMVVIRGVQGLLLPAVFTSVMTFLSASTPPASIRRVMSMYIAATIAGGFLGRLLSGLANAYLTWQVFFVSTAAGLLVCVVLLRRLVGEMPVDSSRPTLRIWLDILRDRAYLTIYLAVFCLFFVFAGLLNFLPFRLAEIQSQPSDLLTGLIYTGYMVGIFTSLGSARIGVLLGGPVRAMGVGFGCYMLTLMVMVVPDVRVLFGVLFLFCGSMFLVHATAAGMINQMSAHRKAVINGLYTTFYYSGGVIGSYVPGVVYEHFGWSVCLVLLLCVSAVGLVSILAIPARVQAGYSVRNV